MADSATQRLIPGFTDNQPNGPSQDRPFFVASGTDHRNAIPEESIHMTDTLSRLRSLDECATACGVNLRTLLKLIDDGKGPAILRIGRQIRIREADFTAWLDQVAAKETAVRARTAVC